MATADSPDPQPVEARDPDARLMLQVRDDVPGAFEVLVERYQHRLVGILALLIGRQGEAEDLAREVFLRIYRTRKGYQPKAKFSTYLFTITSNLALSHLRGKGRHPAVSPGGLGPAAGRIAAPDGAPANPMRQDDLPAVLREALDGLGADQRMAVLLSKFEAMSYAEIARVMDKSEAAVKSLLSRARTDLREKLEPHLRAGQKAP